MLSKLLTLFQRDVIVGLLYQYFFTFTNKVTKATPNSVVDALLQGVGGIAQRFLKDVVLASSVVFIDDATGDAVDEAGALHGVPNRLGATTSSAVLTLVVENPGDPFIISANLGDPRFTSNTGGSTRTFILSEDVFIPQSTTGVPFAVFANVHSTATGSSQNAPPFSINTILRSSPPAIPDRIKILDVSNEFASVGGSDIETDIQYRSRIKDARNILAIDTISRVENVMRNFNESVLRVVPYGMGVNGEARLAIVTSNGALLTEAEISLLTDNIRPYMSLTGSYILQNARYAYVDIYGSIKLTGGVSVSDVATDIQSRIVELYRYDSWDEGSGFIRWDDLLVIFKTVSGVSFVEDDKLFISSDGIAPSNTAVSTKQDIFLGTDIYPKFRRFRIVDNDTTQALFDISNVPILNRIVRQDTFNNFLSG